MEKHQTGRTDKVRASLIPDASAKQQDDEGSAFVGVPSVLGKDDAGIAAGVLAAVPGKVAAVAEDAKGIAVLGTGDTQDPQRYQEMHNLLEARGFGEFARTMDGLFNPAAVQDKQWYISSKVPTVKIMHKGYAYDLDRGFKKRVSFKQLAPEQVPPPEIMEAVNRYVAGDLEDVRKRQKEVFDVAMISYPHDLRRRFDGFFQKVEAEAQKEMESDRAGADENTPMVHLLATERTVERYGGTIPGRTDPLYHQFHRDVEAMKRRVAVDMPDTQKRRKQDPTIGKRLQKEAEAIAADAYRYMLTSANGDVGAIQIWAQNYDHTLKQSVVKNIPLTNDDISRLAIRPHFSRSGFNWSVGYDPGWEKYGVFKNFARRFDFTCNPSNFKISSFDSSFIDDQLLVTRMSETRDIMGDNVALVQHLHTLLTDRYLNGLSGAYLNLDKDKPIEASFALAKEMRAGDPFEGDYVYNVTPDNINELLFWTARARSGVFQDMLRTATGNDYYYSPSEKAEAQEEIRRRLAGGSGVSSPEPAKPPAPPPGKEKQKHSSLSSLLQKLHEREIAQSEVEEKEQRGKSKTRNATQEEIEQRSRTISYGLVCKDRDKPDFLEDDSIPFDEKGITVRPYTAAPRSVLTHNDGILLKRWDATDKSSTTKLSGTTLVPVLRPEGGRLRSIELADWEGGRGVLEQGKDYRLFQDTETGMYYVRGTPGTNRQCSVVLDYEPLRDYVGEEQPPLPIADTPQKKENFLAYLEELSAKGHELEAVLLRKRFDAKGDALEARDVEEVFHTTTVYSYNGNEQEIDWKDPLPALAKLNRQEQCTPAAIKLAYSMKQLFSGIPGVRIFLDSGYDLKDAKKDAKFAANILHTIPISEDLGHMRVKVVANGRPYIFDTKPSGYRPGGARTNMRPPEPPVSGSQLQMHMLEEVYKTFGKGVAGLPKLPEGDPLGSLYKYVSERTEGKKPDPERLADIRQMLDALENPPATLSPANWMGVHRQFGMRYHGKDQGAARLAVLRQVIDMVSGEKVE